MAGKIKALIDQLVRQRAGGTAALEHFVKVNLLLTGIDPDVYTSDSPDDHTKIAQLEKMIADFTSRTGDRRR
jgi:hypothetical protein